jgi:hypothetical protein
MVRTNTFIILNDNLLIPYITHKEFVSTAPYKWVQENPHIIEIEYRLYSARKSLIDAKSEEVIIDLVESECDEILFSWASFETNGFLDQCNIQEQNTQEFKTWAYLWSQTTKESTWNCSILINKIKLTK